MLNLRSSMCLEEYVSHEIPEARTVGSAKVDLVAPEANTEFSFASTADGFETYVPFTSADLLGPPTSISVLRPPPQPQQAIAAQPEALAFPTHRRSNSPDNEPWMRMRTPSPENTYSGYATGRALPGPPGTLLKQDLTLPQQYTPVFVQQQYMPVLLPFYMGVNGQADADSGVGSVKKPSLPSVGSWSTMASEDDRGFEAEDAQCLPCGDSEVAASNFAMESKGSRGHPYSCASACKYIKKVRGCKDGADCDRCHLCAFHNKSKKPGMFSGTQRKAAVGW